MMKALTIGRILGSSLVIVSYFVILHFSPRYGAMIHLTSCCLSIPFYTKVKSYDVVVMLSFMCCISISKIVVS